MDVMERPWCCLDCRGKFTFGDCRTKRGSPHIHCPKCGSIHLHPMDGETRDVPDYEGVIPDRVN